ncbi:cytochrome c oxidase assembly protein [Thiolinea disciformis]|uniref:cytochrome c oxidase assembly protein n=1 Tax=Thiolinea disciformis TaxID=125614 RepID=UPI0003822A28|nr:cytochrome c oxidase assembly protein [Thiolinea disciformis]
MSKQRLAPLVTKLFLIPIAMFGFGYAMVPLYNVFCEVTGLNGKTGAISSAEANQLNIDKTRSIKVEFTSSVNNEGPWDFHPAQPSMMIHPGETYTTTFFATNKLNKDLVSQSIPSVAPITAASHFKKTECFCFTEQAFKALETREMPVTFVVDNAVPNDVDTITLSYTLFTKP